MFSYIRSKYRSFRIKDFVLTVSTMTAMAAVVLPMAIQPQEIAKQAMCANNLRIISNGLHAYLEDNDHRFPIVPSCRAQMLANNLRYQGPYMQDLLQKYITNGHAWLCPAVSPNSLIPPYPYTNWSNYRWKDNCGSSQTGRTMPTNYSWCNAHLNSQMSLWTDIGGLSDQLVSSPSEALMFIELPFWSESTPHKTGTSPAVNTLFYDGHVKLVQEPNSTYLKLIRKGWAN